MNKTFLSLCNLKNKERYYSGTKTGTIQLLYCIYRID